MEGQKARETATGSFSGSQAAKGAGSIKKTFFY